MNQFCEMKRIKREFSVARTPQQNGVAERRNRTLIEAARTMLVDSKLPTTFWVEPVNTTCYVLNRVLVTKPHNKTPYELIRGRTPLIDFMKPFGYSVVSKAMRVFNKRTKIVEETLNIRFLENAPNVTGNRPDWLFNVDSLSKSINYVPVIASTNSNDFVGSEVSIGEGSTSKKTGTSQDYIVMPLWKDSSLIDFPSINVSHDEPELSCDAEKKDHEGVSKESGVDDQEKPESGTKNINTIGPSINTASANLKTDNVTSEAIHTDLFGDETEMDMSNLNASYHVPTTSNTRIHKDHSLDHVIGDIQSGEEPKRVTKALSDSAWVKAMQEELLQFRLQKVWVIVDLPMGKWAIDVKSVFHYGQIEEEVYVCQPPGFEDPDYPNKVLQGGKSTLWFASSSKSLFEGLMHKRFQMSSMGELTFFLGLQVQQKKDGIFISQDKYVAEILKKFDFATVKTASTPMEPNKALVKDEEADNVDVHLYRSMIRSLMYLIASKPDIMFVVCACARFQVTPKTSHLYVVKRIFRYLKGQPKLGLWYPRDSPFDLEAFLDSDYAGASLDRKSTTGDCQFLGKRLISWQCKKQTIVANSTTKVEYVAAAHCCG
ncbi:putative ribonuclease H-like domain-containing protein [Tanacetum coccineum]